ncbi:DUF1684 domain-containing protein [Tellurirhabdus bombi]|uniref:DUF1684 domain-containing protein n=1 Tax=Tellurirhabdus bombi TaxID=2907205 RepID=UPI001F3B7008|nr:DUF1684 domain-containing protein [Tellurirhabdus bombi]
MFRKSSIIVLLLIVGGLLYFFVIQPKGTADSGVDPQKYKQELTQQRVEKDEFYRTSAESPIIDKAKFTGLTYFEGDPAYRVTARLELFADKTQKMVVTLTDGSEEVYEKYAHAVFSLQGEICRLLLLKHDNTLSILFKDETSGKETYGGGRYVDIPVDKVEGNSLVIDFNTAYNPYCVFNHEYACPLPPAENKLPIAVRAGEKYVER